MRWHSLSARLNNSKLFSVKQQHLNENSVCVGEDVDALNMVSRHGTAIFGRFLLVHLDEVVVTLNYRFYSCMYGGPQVPTSRKPTTQQLKAVVLWVFTTQQF